MATRPVRILVGIDFSECSVHAVRYAAWLAERLGAAIDLVHVFPYTSSAVAELVRAQGEIGQFVDAKRRLGTLRVELVPRRIPAQIHMRLGRPADGLLRAIHELAPSVVCLGSHGRSELATRIIGSVSQRVTLHSPVPVLVVPPQVGAGATVTPGAVTAIANDTAFSCARCGHLRGADGNKCSACGLSPARWDSAPVLSGVPVDLDAPSVGGDSDHTAATINDRYEPLQPFSIAPPGTEGQDVNPELRVRY